MSNKKIFTQKLKHGTFQIVMTFVLLTILVVTNLIVTQMDLKFDLTPDKKYSLGEESKEYLKDVNETVNIYPLFPSEFKDDRLIELIDQYEKINKNIVVTYKDPIKNPSFTAKYIKDNTTIPNGSIIVESEKRFKIISYGKLIGRSQDEQGKVFESEIKIEPEITNAILYTLKEKSSVVYALSGHNEKVVPAEFVNVLDYANLEFNTLEIGDNAEIPEDCSTIIITTPKTDYSNFEYEKIVKYLENNGRALFILEHINYEAPNFTKLITNYGIKVSDYFIREGEAGLTLQQDNLWFRANMSDNKILETLVTNKMYPLFYKTAAIEILPEKKNSLTIEPLVFSTDKSFGKLDGASDSPNKEAGDIDGPFSIATYITDSYYIGNDNFETKIVAIANTNILDIDNKRTEANLNAGLFLKFVEGLQDGEETKYIASKDLTSAPRFELSSILSLVVLIFVILVMPIIFVTMGIFVWLKRRNK